LVGGTDPSGAGLQTDWKVANALQIEACSVVTAVTSQNNGTVLDSGILPSQQFQSQLAALKNEEFSAIKIGMLGNGQIIEVLLKFLENLSADIPIILDPVLAASSGGALLSEQGVKLLLSKLLPLVSVVTPNLDELALLTHSTINNVENLEQAANQLLDLGAKSVLVKGGHFQADSELSTDFYISKNDKFCLIGNRWPDRKNVRGTGCVFATSIAAMMSKGYCLPDALVLAKAIVSQGIRQALKTGEQYKFHFDPVHANENFSLQDLPKLTHSFEMQDSRYDFPDCGSMKLGLYPVVDSVEWIKKLVLLGIETIQLRIKTDIAEKKTPEQIEQEIIEAILFCREHKARLFINDHWRLALKHKAYGIHLGQEDLATANLQEISDSECRLGISTHSYMEVARTHAINPSYIALGPIFATTSKDMPWIPQGVPAVENWVKLLGEEYPLVAIGGINFERAESLKQTGVGSVAMITAITEASDYKQATSDLLAMWNA